MGDYRPLISDKMEGFFMNHEAPKFSISEFSKQARITVRTLRFYEELGLLVPTERNESGHRLYGLNELAKLQQIQSLKFLGYPLQEIKDFIKDEMDGAAQLEKSLPLQHKLLTEKRDELNQAIEAVERVQNLLKAGKSINWTVLSSLLFQMEHEEDLKEWAKEYLPESVAKEYFSLPKEYQQLLDVEMLDWLAKLEKLMQDNVPANSPEAFELLMGLTELATRHVEDKEAFAMELEKAQELMDQETMDFQFPTMLTSEQESYLMKIGEEMEALYKENEE